jgi:homopolymeric O-antigen transport system ATP-binding protein
MTAHDGIAIRVQHVSKQFRLGARHNEFPTLRESLTAGAARAARRIASFGRSGDSSTSELDIIHALGDVSFDVRQGETLGIIGANGAGKSTLLKVLARVTEPTSGRAEVHGRLGSLLEVGTGFHQELTGRENIFLNGAILGMKRAEIRQRFDEIVAFSEVERFIDTAVKFYSSGMYLRLAFAVAAHLEPEILLVDEVLAVGDAAFQQKCMGKMGDVARQGRTILFVSHNMIAMEGLCDRLIWMKDGRIAEDGPTTEVVTNYLRTFATSLTEQRWSDSAEAPGNEHVRMHAARVRPRDGAAGDVISVATPLALEFEYWRADSDARLVPSLHVFNDQGIVVFNVGPTELKPWHERTDGPRLIRDVCHVPGNLLNDGVHRVAFCLSKGHDLVYWLDDALVFDVRDTVTMRDAWYGKWDGVIRPALDWQTEILGDAASSRPGGRQS